LFAILIVGAASAVYYWMATERQRRAHQLEAPALTPAVEGAPPAGAATAAAEAARVEIVVSSEVEGGELVVDGESYGTNSKNEWVLELPPGPHRLEARAQGNTITWKRIDVREASPDQVLLSLPVGTDGVLGADAGAAEAESPRGAASTSRDAKRRERASRNSGDAGRAHRRRTVERGGVYDPTTASVVVPAPLVPGGVPASAPPKAVAGAQPVKSGTTAPAPVPVPPAQPARVASATDAGAVRAASGPAASPSPGAAATPKRDH
jgi:hypothetical protein